MNDEDRRKLVSTEKSLEMDVEEKHLIHLILGDIPVNSPNAQAQSDEGQDYRMRTVSLIYQRRELRLTTISKTVLAF